MPRQKMLGTALDRLLDAIGWGLSDHAIAQARSAPAVAKMTNEDYGKLAGRLVLDTDGAESYEPLLELFNQGDPLMNLPTLWVNKRGQVTDHEGRNRFLAFDEVHESPLPVILRAESLPSLPFERLLPPEDPYDKHLGPVDLDLLNLNPKGTFLDDIPVHGWDEDSFFVGFEDD